MNTNNIVVMIDEEITRLTQARNLLAEIPTHMSMIAHGRNGMVDKARMGRKPGSKNKPKMPTMMPARKKHVLSQEGRQRIADALRRRWAAQKAAKAAPAPEPPMKKTAKKAAKAIPAKKAAKKVIPKKAGQIPVAVDGPIPAQV